MSVTNLYFIADMDRRFVKIGVSLEPSRRLRDLQAGSPLVLGIDHIEMNVPLSVELSLHQHFAKYWLHREWFAYAEPICDLVTELQAGNRQALAAIPPAPIPKGFRTRDGWLLTREDTLRHLRDGYEGSFE